MNTYVVNIYLLFALRCIRTVLRTYGTCGAYVLLFFACLQAGPQPPSKLAKKGEA